MWSIPACAGEPWQWATVSSANTVYPRVCGGTLAVGNGFIGKHGLSPRVRGNRPRRPAASQAPRSIPACAGEPTGLPPYAGQGEVYPRVCGGTSLFGSALYRYMGLSPRVRGNPHRSSRRPARLWSIPACAGEPGDPRRNRQRTRVYPRVCGGTPASVWRDCSGAGLSPRVRGNPPTPGPSFPGTRSIPACAGEPCQRVTPPALSRVYPRVCGGTHLTDRFQYEFRGLSPRVRGNRRLGRVFAAGGGSIPACAGEPSG